MKIGLCVCLCIGLGLIHGRAVAQQADSVRLQPADSAAIQQFLTDTGPAEAVFSLTMPPPYRFKSGVYRVTDLAFPLRQSPDSLVRLPVERAYKQGRRARIAAIATVVPLAVLAYSVTRIVFGLLTVVAGRSSSGGLPNGDVIRTSGFGAMAGSVTVATFNIASVINLQKGVKRHNRQLGRKMPTLFNPKGL